MQSDGTWNYSYDADGNLIGKAGITGGPDAGLTWTYSYDASNELTSATETNAQSQTLVQANYAYDAFDHRIQSSVSLNGGTAVASNFVYNGDQLYAQLNGSGALQMAYITGDQADQYFAQIDASAGANWLLTDHLGSVRATTNAAGQATDGLSYDAYGNLIAQSNPSQPLFIRYAGYFWNAALGVYFTDARPYEPDMSRFWTQDPTGLGPDSNEYRYTRNGPTNATDPSGLEEKLVNPQAALNQAFLASSTLGNPLSKLTMMAAERQPRPVLTPGLKEWIAQIRKEGGMAQSKEPVPGAVKQWRKKWGTQAKLDFCPFFHSSRCRREAAQ